MSHCAGWYPSVWLSLVLHLLLITASGLQIDKESIVASELPSVHARKQAAGSPEEERHLEADRGLSSVDALKQAVFTEPGLHEINGTTLNLLLEDVRSKEELFLGVFFYAHWCPFSQQLRPLIFHALPALFPHLPLVAVEEKAVKPSALSKYGVYSFPLFFIYSKNHRSKFVGTRKLETLVEMITTATGYNPVAHPKADYCEANVTLLDHLTPIAESRSQTCPDLHAYHQRALPEDTCPYRWTFQPSIWASNDLYLALASVFLALRFTVYVLQKGSTWLRLRQVVT